MTPILALPAARSVLLAVVVLLAAACDRGADKSAAADSTFVADQQKAEAARDAAFKECESLPGAAKQDCRSVAGAEFERLMGEAKARHEAVER